MTKSGQLTRKMIKNDQKSNKLEGHVVAGKSTNNVVESNKSPVITGFFHAPNTSEYTLDTFLDTFRSNSGVLSEATKCIQ